MNTTLKDAASQLLTGLLQIGKGEVQLAKEELGSLWKRSAIYLGLLGAGLGVAAISLLIGIIFLVGGIASQMGGSFWFNMALGMTVLAVVGIVASMVAVVQLKKVDFSMLRTKESLLEEKEIIMNKLSESLKAPAPPIVGDADEEALRKGA